MWVSFLNRGAKKMDGNKMGMTGHQWRNLMPHPNSALTVPLGF